MARQVQTFFLEEWLRINSSDRGTDGSSSSSISSVKSSSMSARAIIQAWSDLRDSLRTQLFRPQHLQSLKTLFNSGASLFVADPQAKLIVSVLSAENLSLPEEAYPLLFRLLYIWVRKSSKPALPVVASAVEVLSRIFVGHFDTKKHPLFFSEGVLVLGALSFVPSPDSSRATCLGILGRLLEEEYPLGASSEGLTFDVFAGIGYALASADDVHFFRILRHLLGVWGKDSGPSHNVSHGLMVLHLVEWVMSSYFSSRSLEKANLFMRDVYESPKTNYVPFVLVMASAGALRASNKAISSGLRLEVVSKLRKYAEEKVESVARDLISKTDYSTNPNFRQQYSMILQCISLALARSGFISSRPAILVCLASALLTEIFPVKRFYSMILDVAPRRAMPLLADVNKHLDSVLFKDAGLITGVFCNQYASVDEEHKQLVEKLVWDYCQDIYSGHRRISLLLRGGENELLKNIEKIAESAFLMVVVFALAVSKDKLNSKFHPETRIETSVRILVSFSCIEYFRRMRLPEYMETIRGVAVTIQESQSACISFVESMPSYDDLRSTQYLDRNMEYIWLTDEVQTARILFYLRVVPTCVEQLAASNFKKTVAPTMFLYMGHSNTKVAQASHSVFSAFISSGKDSDQEDRVLLKEQLVFYYVQRSLEGYPGVTPFDGLASGVAALVRYLPAGSPAIFYCVHSLVDKANRLCSESLPEDNSWKNWQGASEKIIELLIRLLSLVDIQDFITWQGASEKIIELLIRLLSLVDIQVLPNLMKLLAQLVVQLPQSGQNMVLNELYSQVADSDDVTRKPMLVSWVQSLSYLCSQTPSKTSTTRPVKSKEDQHLEDKIGARL